MVLLTSTAKVDLGDAVFDPFEQAFRWDWATQETPGTTSGPEDKR